MADVRLERRDSWRSENILRPSCRLTRVQSNVAAANRRVCKFFASPNGCAHGENCNFTHDRECRKAARTYSGRQECKFTKKNQVIVSGLPRNARPEDLFRLFDLEFGRVLDAIIPVEELGIVTFQSSAAASAAIHAGHVHFFGRKVTIRDAHASGESCNGMEPPSRDMLQEDHELKPPQEDRQPLLTGDEPLPPWVVKFVEWLPDFLDQVERRLGEGQCYPLCTLKGDFRATCGMELDHASVGYEKLADFLRTEVPHICKLKVVPVGTGPATHIVIEKSQPLSSNLKLPSAGSADSSIWDSLFFNQLSFGSDPRAEGEQATGSIEVTEIPASIPVTTGEAAIPRKEALPIEAVGPEATAPAAATGSEAAAPLDISDAFSSLYSYDLWKENKLAKAAMELWKDNKPTTDMMELWKDKNKSEPDKSFMELWKDNNNPESDKEQWKASSNNLGVALRCDCCWDKLATCVALPCGHFALCASCKQVLLESDLWTSDCSTCHEPVASWMDL